MQELPIPAMVAMTCAVLSWLIVGSLKQSNAKLREENEALTRPAREASAFSG
jgi:heme exporter protein D